MTIKTRQNADRFLEVIINSQNTSIIEDLSIYKDGKFTITNNDIEMFITVANDCSRFNGIKDIDFVKKIFDVFLSDNEKESFIELILEQSKNKT